MTDALAQLIGRLDDVLPQTQCTQCGFTGCLPYARAMAAGDADINRCPPGGDRGVAALAQVLGKPVMPLDTSRGAYGPLALARIDEEHCIGCTLCIQACPVDAIVGANKRMHTVLADECTGCELCLAPCPVDCITMEPVEPVRFWQPADAHEARLRFRRREARLERLALAAPGAAGPRAIATNSAVAAAPATAAPSPSPDASTGSTDDHKQAAVAAALARARARRAARP